MRKTNIADRDDDVVTTAVAGETVMDQVEGLGAVLLLTPTRAILVRQGAHFRPRNGVREWALGVSATPSWRRHATATVA